MSAFVFGIEYKFAKTNGPIILTGEEAELEEMRNDIIRDEFDREVFDIYVKYDLSDSKIWQCIGSYITKIGEVGERRMFGINSPVYRYYVWKKYVAKTTGKIVHQICGTSDYCALDEIE